MTTDWRIKSLKFVRVVAGVGNYGIKEGHWNGRRGRSKVRGSSTRLIVRKIKVYDKRLFFIPNVLYGIPGTCW